MTASPAPARPHRLPAWLRVVLCMLGLIVASSASVPVTLIPPLERALNGENLVASVLAFTLVSGVTLGAYLLLSWLLVRFADRRSFADLGLGGGWLRSLRGLLLGMAVSLVVVVACVAIVQVSGAGRSVPADTGGAPAWFVAVYVLLLAFVLQGVGEEVLFRGYLLQSLAARPRLAAVISAAAFALMHLISQGGQQNAFERIAYLAIPFGFALAAGLLAIALRSVWAAIGIHGGFHVANNVRVLLGFTVDGPVLWIMLGVAFSLVAVVTWRLIPRSRWAEVAAHGPYAPVGH